MRWSARTRAEVLFVLRIAPPVLALAAVGLFLLPAYFHYEPQATDEVVSAKLAGLAIVSAFGVIFAATRCGRAIWATRTLRKQWMAAATEISLPGVHVRTFRLVHSFPIIAVVGTIRPRLFIAERVLQSLSEEELAAAIGHEHGHLKARDNLKRGLLRACRDALMVPWGGSLDRSWSQMAEAAADEYAAQTSPQVALNLASALVRIARMVPSGPRAELPVASLLVGDETRGIKARVRRLIELASSNSSQRPGSFEISRLAPVFLLAAAFVPAALLAGNAKVLLTVHVFMERVVLLLS
jgi:Zn-dependent protease with chaperone function